FKLLCKKALMLKGQLAAFTTDAIWATDDLDGINKEAITSIIINQLRKLNYIIVHADGKISINDIGKGHCNEEIILPENIR
ncbi:MAG TPA: hypothetical protein VKA09_17200, partial [Nitrososphaeraceae archaeon]|nr:hypothetical protein [Nitrososphaeraceae archaeon]